MKIYIDHDFKCHVNQYNDFREIETEFFIDKCQAYIEGYMFIPSNETWTRNDGVVFHGEMIFPWKNHSELIEIQHEYERQKLLNLENELNTSYLEGVNSI